MTTATGIEANLYKLIETINTTLNLLDSGQITETEALGIIQADLYLLDIVDSPDEILGKISPTGLTLDDVYWLLYSTSQLLYTTILSESQSLLENLSYSISFSEQEITQNMLALFTEQTNLLYSLNQQLSSDVNTAIDNLSTSISYSFNDLSNYIVQLFINNANRTQQMLDNQTSIMNQLLTDKTNQIISTVNSQELTTRSLIDSSTSQILGSISSIDNTDNFDEQAIVNGLSNSFNFNTDKLVAVINDFINQFMLKNFDVTIDSASLFGNTGEGDTSQQDFIQTLLDVLTFQPIPALGNLLAKPIGNEWEGVADRFTMLVNLFNKAVTGGYETFDGLMEDFNNIAGTGNFSEVLLGIFLFVPVIVGGVASSVVPFVNNIQTLARTKALDGVIPPSILNELLIRGLITRNYYEDLMKRNGFDVFEDNLLLQASTVQLPENFLRELYLRDLISEQNYELFMNRLGFSSSDAEFVKQTYTKIPPIPDLIRFAVREAYDDNLAETLNLDFNYDNIKERFEADLKKNGLVGEYGKYYWRAHWDLPSPQMGFEMLHRGIIKPAEMKALLQALDYSPAWQQKLIDIAYANYTRVDIRRMNKLGVIKDEDLINEYQHIGYDLEKATHLAEFTIKLNTEVENEVDKHLSVTQITKAFHYNIIDYNTALTMIQQIGYSLRESEVLIQIYQLGLNADTSEDITKDNRARIISSTSRGFINGTVSEQTAKIQFSQIGYSQLQIDTELSILHIERNNLRQSERVANIAQSYIEFRIDDRQARDRLILEGFTPVEENDIIALWNTQRKNRFKEPTKSELFKWFINDKITISQYKNYLFALGYDNFITDLYLNDAIEAKAEKQQDNTDTTQNTSDVFVSPIFPPLEPIIDKNTGEPLPLTTTAKTGIGYDLTPFTPSE